VKGEGADVTGGGDTPLEPNSHILRRCGEMWDREKRTIFYGTGTALFVNKYLKTTILEYYNFEMP
jgi:hypothetical protein